MANDGLTQIDNLINKAYDVIKTIDNDYKIKNYTPELIIERGKYGFNIMPQSVTTREVTGQLSLPNLAVDIFMHYDMGADDDFQEQWKEFMKRGTVILNALYDKTNFPSGVSTVTINIAFDNPIGVGE